MVFSFEHIGLDEEKGKNKWHLQKMSLVEFKQVIQKWQKGLHGTGWNSIYLSNHDQPRAVSRWGNDTNYRVESAKCLANTFQMLQGSPYIYQGEEFGMTNCRFDDISDYKDIETLNFYQEYSNIWPREKIMDAIYAKGRDNARTPLQWNADTHAGFSSVIPWINLNPNYLEINAAAAIADTDSIWYFYKKLIQLRKDKDIITYGDFDLIAPNHPEVFAFIRNYHNDLLVVVSNWSGLCVNFDLEFTVENYEILISNYKRHNITQSLELRPFETISFIICNA